MKVKRALSYDDVLLVPQYSEVVSRKEVNLGIKLKNFPELLIPVVASPMDTITGGRMAATISEYGGVGIIHRYSSVEEQVLEVERAVKLGAERIGAGVGITGDFVQRAKAVQRAGANLICVDVAHGHHCLMRHALKVLRNTIGNSAHIMAGNIATRVGLDHLAEWGADSVRVGIGGGSICSTRIQTGHGVPTFQSILDCSSTASDVSIIADGGIKNSGDIVKALAAGADAVMIGSLLAGTPETPGEYYRNEKGDRYKVYRGMASKEAQIKWRGHYSSVEGVTTTVQGKPEARHVLYELEAGIRSGLSYSGSLSILDLQRKAIFIEQSHAGSIESATHIFNL